MSAFAGLRPYQVPHAQKVLRGLLYNKGFLDASDTGVGKTYTTLCIARIFGCVPLVLGPKGTRSGWEDASRLMGVPIEFYNYEKARRESYGFGHEKEMFKRLDPTQPESAENPALRCGSYWVWDRSFQMVVFDEAHLCGGSTSLTGKLLRSSRKAADYVLALSATAADSAEQMKNIGIALGLFNSQGYYTWLRKHGVEEDYTGRLQWSSDEEKQRAAMAKVHAEVFGTMRGARLCRRDIPNFPKTQIDTMLLDTDVEFGEQDPADLAERTALRQKLEKEIVRQLQSIVKERLDTTDRRITVFLNFRESIDEFARWAEKKKIPCGIIDGRQVGESGDIERREVISKIQGNVYRLGLVNNAAGGAGLNLHDPRGQVVCETFIVPSETGRQMKQVVGRVHRDGGAFSMQWFCGLRGTFQETNLRTNQAKIRNIDTLNGDVLDTMKFY